MNIKEHPSPNFSQRVTSITCLVIHATGDSHVEQTLDWFESHESKVSSHYVIDKNGDIYQCVDDRLKAWHAGESSLWGVSDVNEFSLGVELVNLNNDKEEYTPEQILSLLELSTLLCDKYSIWLNRVVGHQHISPDRKVDPGVQFPWKEFLISLGGHLA